MWRSVLAHETANIVKHSLGKFSTIINRRVAYKSIIKLLYKTTNLFMFFFLLLTFIYNKRWITVVLLPLYWARERFPGGGGGGGDPSPAGRATTSSWKCIKITTTVQPALPTRRRINTIKTLAVLARKRFTTGRLSTKTAPYYFFELFFHYYYYFYGRPSRQTRGF